MPKRRSVVIVYFLEKPPKLVIKWTFYRLTNYTFNNLYVRVIRIRIGRLDYSYAFQEYEIMNVDEQRKWDTRNRREQIPPGAAAAAWAWFYQELNNEHYGHEENELQHIGLPVIKKHEVAAKLSQGVTIGRILDDFRDNIGSNLKREDLITRADLHNIKHKYNINIQHGQFHKDNCTSVDIWVEQMKEQGENNPVQYYKKQEPDHLKEAIKKIDALNAFIDATSKQSAPNKEFIKVNNDPPNKKITTQKNFFSTKSKRKKPENDLSKPSELESNELRDTFLNKKFKILQEKDVEHSCFKKQ
ncbi:hypothetical protein ACI65C_013402 [Semiaphis heraclei]